MAKYALQLTDPFGNHITNLDWLNFDCSRAINTLGNASITVSGRYPIGFFRKNQRVMIYRHTHKGGYLVGHTAWFVRQFTYDDDQDVWTIRAQDNLFILNGPIVAYRSETTYADKTFDNANEGKADDLMKVYLRENIGVDATDTFRDQSAYLTIEPEDHQGGFTEKQASYRKLLNVCQELAEDTKATGTEIYFDVQFVEKSNPPFIFFTRRGDLYGDRTALFTFSRLNGTLEKASLDWDYTKEVTYAYVGGDGQGAERLVAELDSGLDTGAPFERVEEFFDARDSYANSVLQSEARSQLEKVQGLLTLSGSLKETADIKFGHEFDYGQRVRVAIRNYQTDAIIDKFSIRAERGGSDQLDISVKGSVKELLYPTLTVPAVPDAPVLTTSSPTVSTIYASWTGTVTDSYSGYFVERSTDNIAYTRIATLTSLETFYLDTNLTSATLYYYRIKAYNAIGTSDPSNVDSETTL